MSGEGEKEKETKAHSVSTKSTCKFIENLYWLKCERFTLAEEVRLTDAADITFNLSTANHQLVDKGEMFENIQVLSTISAVFIYKGKHSQSIAPEKAV